MSLEQVYRGQINSLVKAAYEAGYDDKLIEANIERLVEKARAKGVPEDRIHRFLYGDLPVIQAPKNVSWLDRLIWKVRDYLGLYKRKTTPLEIMAVEEGVPVYKLREEFWGTGRLVELEKVIDRFFSGLTGGLYELFKDVERPETTVGTIAGSVAELGGFLLGPMKLAHGITGSWFRPTSTGLRAVAQILARGGASLGLASGIASIIPEFLEKEDDTAMALGIMRHAGLGAVIGAIFPGLGAIESRPLRVAVGLAVMDKIRAGKDQWFTVDDVVRGIADGTIDKRELAERAYGYLLDLYFLNTVPSMKEQLQSLNHNAAVKEMELSSEELEKLIVEIGKRRLVPDVKEEYAPGTKSDVLSFVIKQGGIHPAAEGAKEFTPTYAEYPRLTSEKGLAPEEMLQRMKDAGFLDEKATVEDMYNLMCSELQRVKALKKEAPEVRDPSIKLEAQTFEVDKRLTEVLGEEAPERELAEVEARLRGVKTEDLKINELRVEEEAKVLEEQHKEALKQLGIKEVDPDTIEIDPKDYRDWYKYLQFPDDVRRSHPEFDPIYQIQRGREIKKAALDYAFADYLKPYFTLSSKERQAVDRALIEGERQKVDMFDDNVLREEFGLNDRQIEGYKVIRRGLNMALDILTDKMRQAGMSEEDIQKFRDEVQGYVPHKWYGKWAILVKDKEGKTVYMSAVSRRERYAERDRLKAIFPPEEGYRYVILKRNQIPYEAYQEAPHWAVSRMLDLVMERAGVEEGTQEAMYRALSDLYKSKGFGMHFIKRKNVPGWEQDLARPLAEYFSGFTGYITKMEAVQEFGKAIRLIDPSRKPNLYRYSLDYIRYVTGDVLEFRTAKGFLYFWYLFGNIKSASLQLTQNIILGWPVLGKRTKFALPKMLDAMARVATGRLSPEEKAFLEQMEREGYIDPKFSAELSGYIGNPIYAGIKTKASKALSFLDVFRHMERFNRRSMALACYRAGIRDPKEVFELVNEAHFWYARGNRPVLWRGPVSIFTVFRSFMVNYMTWLKNEIKAGRVAPVAKSLFALILFGGLKALMGYKIFREEYIKHFGTSPEEDAREAMGPLAKYLWHGVPAAVGVEFSGSVGFADIIPTNLEQLGGVFMEIPKRAKKVLRDLRSGDVLRAVEDASPEVARNPFAAYRLFKKGAFSRSGRPIISLRTGKQLKLTKAEAIKKALGFYPLRMAEEREIQETVDIVKRQRMEKKQEWADRYVVAYLLNDTEEYQKIYKEWQEWNRKMVEAGRLEDQIPWEELSRMIERRMRPLNIPPQYMIPKVRKIQKAYR